MEAGVVSQAWALQLPLSSASALGPLRMLADLRAGVADESVWLRGDILDDALRQRLLSLPATNRYSVSTDGTLTPWDRITPAGYLPKVAWLPLRQWGELTLPARGWPGAPPSGVRLTLIRDMLERPSGALLAAWEAWLAYVETAPQIRLDGLAFALSAERKVIVRGDALPSLPGMRLMDERGILVPAGWYWTPAVDGQAVRELFRLRDGECAFWQSSERWERIAAEAWVKTTRSAVRATAREASHV